MTDQSSMPAYPSGGAHKPGSDAPVHPSNTLPVTAFVLSLLGLVGFGIVTAIPGVILGRKARREIAAGRASGDGLAKAAVVIGWIAIVLSLIVIAVWIIAIFVVAAEA